MEKFKRTWNETQDMSLADRMDFSMSTSCTIKPIARHHLHTKTGSGYDRMFPGLHDDLRIQLGKGQHPTIISSFRHCQTRGTLESMTEDVDKAISDYKVTSAER